MSALPAHPTRRANRGPLLYTWITGGFLLLQGTSTLLFRLVPALDAAFPALLAVTQMIPIHSVVHIATGLLALGVIRWGGPRGPWWFAAGFGTFYTVLGLAGLLTAARFGLGLQPFDHPFHLLAGVPGLLAAAVAYRPRARQPEAA
jgi:hypothetical protein